MKTFQLYHSVDESGISGRGTVAEGVQFADSSCVLRWTSVVRITVFYDSIEAVEKIHGHGGKTEIIWTSDPFNRGRIDAIQDRCENAPFDCIGGLEKRDAPEPRSWITSVTDKSYRDDWLRGYLHGCREMFGEDWKTCDFGWQPAIRIEAKEGADA